MCFSLNKTACPIFSSNLFIFYIFWYFLSDVLNFQIACWLFSLSFNQDDSIRDVSINCVVKQSKGFRISFFFGWNVIINWIQSRLKTNNLHSNMTLMPPEGAVSSLIEEECVRNVLVGAVNPGHSNVLQKNNDEERQSSRIVIKHGYKVVPRSLDKY